MLRAMLVALLLVASLAAARADGGFSAPGVVANGQGQLPSMAGGVAPSTIYVPTVAQSIATASETSLFASTGSGVGLTIPGGGPYAGNRYLLRASGQLTTPLSVGTVTVKAKWGSTTVASISGLAILSSLTGSTITLESTCTFRSISPSANSSTLTCSAQVLGATTSVTLFSSSSPVSVDTTTAQKLDMTWTFSSITGSPSLSISDADAEILY